MLKYNYTLVNIYTVMQVSRKLVSSLVIFEGNPSFPSEDISHMKTFLTDDRICKAYRNQFAFS